MFVDSHCHLSDASLVSQMDQVLLQMQQARVTQALCISTTLADFEQVRQLAHTHANLWASIGVHPENEHDQEPLKSDLLSRAADARVVAIGETGLDYFQFGERSHAQMQWQRDRFSTHIEAAREAALPLVIHTRAAAADTVAMLKEAVNGPGKIQGVFHCFTETMDVARQALDLGFYISFSGILTFKNAAQLREVAQMVPHDACLIETDSPYLAPVPYRGKTNMPAYVPFVAAVLADLWRTDAAHVGAQTTRNFETLFAKVKGTA
ncbi:putative metal-dependent hydrolase YcfH [Saezia sanguinis]|uniref:Putative metal-dependent hydrolase YcfH n=1 Tax=Saezia sanguinis TaxID=1965230 RepID=A0A433SBM6_9BURK|nr:TatD family hydrolase [Saezia sanguinis]RUS66135.1 putative metal-dependent hydrolase YcfH [Saezia sanguinis]